MRRRVWRRWIALAAMIAPLAMGSAVRAAEAAGKITGIGGVFVTSKDPKALAAWYRDVLGVPLEAWGGAALKTDAPGHPPVITWNAFKDGEPYLKPSTRDFMLDFAVDDLDAILARLKAKGVPVLGRQDQGAAGKFAWVLDPDGTKVELWEPGRK